MLFLLPALAILSCQAQKPAQVWTEQNLTEGFKVSAPVKLSKMDLSDKKIPKDASVPLTWKGESEDGIFSVMIADDPDMRKQDPRKALTVFAAGFTEQTNGTLDGERNLLIQGYPGIALTIKMEGGFTMATRAYLYEGRMIVQIVDYATDAKRPDSVDKYFNSLKFPKPGTWKDLGPTMTRFDCGDGISALFPWEPEKNDEAELPGAYVGKKFHTHYASFCFRTFTVLHLVAPEGGPEPSDKDKATMFKLTLDSLAGLMKAKTVTEREFVVGTDKGLLREFTAPDDSKGTMAVLLHGRKVVIISTIGPAKYPDPTTIDAFLKSIQFKD